MSKQKALFFLRHYNDIDHIVPVLYKWLSLKDIPTEVMITTDRNHLHDYRIQFLRQFDNLRVRFIDDFIPQEKPKRKSLKSRIIEQMNSYLPSSVAYRIAYRTSKKLFSLAFPSSQTLYDASFVERMLNSVFKGVDAGIVVFDWTHTDFVRLVTRAAKERGLTTISLPHGDRPYYNLMTSLNNLDYSHLDSYAPAAMFDYTVVPNGLCTKRLKPYVERDRIKILGSPRYNDEWLHIISTLLLPYDTPEWRGKLKVVFFLRNFNYSIFWEEVIRTIKLVLQFPNVCLIVKPHTRGNVQKLIQAYPELNAENVPNLKFVHNEVHSGSLLQWADVVLDLGTSVSFEAVKRGKPVLALEYLHANRSTVAHYIRSCDIQCRDELYDWMQRFSQDKTIDFYDERQRQQFIEEIVDVPDTNVLERYVKFLEQTLFCFKVRQAGFEIR